jgi:fermentation-respiration switch protein FrsA (DUF1100 family)
LLSPWFERFICDPLKVNVFLYDYSGYGDSDGECSEENVYADVEAAYDYLKTELKVPPSSVILYGRSLGSGPTTYLASKYANDGIRGVILQSALLSVYRISFNFRFTLPGDMFPNIDRLASIKSPTFVIHGTRDEVVPFWHGQRIYDLLQNPVRPLFIEGGGHNNLETDFEPLILSKLSSFIYDLNVDLPSPSGFRTPDPEPVAEASSTRSGNYTNDSYFPDAEDERKVGIIVSPSKAS